MCLCNRCTILGTGISCEKTMNGVICPDCANGHHAIQFEHAFNQWVKDEFQEMAVGIAVLSSEVQKLKAELIQKGWINQ